MNKKILILLNRAFDFNDRSTLTTIERLERNNYLNFLTQGTVKNKKFNHFFFIPKLITKFIGNGFFSNILFSIFETHRLPLSYLKIFYVCWKVKPDILYLRELKYLIPCLIIKKYLKNNIFLHLDIRENPSTQNQGKFLNNFLKNNSYLIDEVSTISYPLKNLLVKKYNFKKKKINCFFTLPTKNFNPRLKHLKNYKYSQTINFCFFGDIKKDRNIHFFSDVLKKLPKNFKYNFDIYGNAIDKVYLNKITDNNYNPNINYKGILAYNKASSILQNYDIAVLTNEINSNSKYTIPGKFWEYLSCGLPIISNNRPSLKGFFKNYNIGWFVKTPKELKNCLKKIIENKEKLTNKKNNCLKLFNKIFNDNKNLIQLKHNKNHEIIKKKKILFITAYKFPPAIRVLKEVQSLNKNGYECAVLSPPFKNQKEFEIWKNIKIFRPKFLKIDFFDKIFFMISLFSPRWFLSIYKITKIYKPDAIHLHDIWIGKSTFASTKSVPVIIDLLENMPAAVLQYFKDLKGIHLIINKFFFNYNRLLSYEKSLLTKADVAIVVAKEAYKRVLNEHKGFSKKKLILVENLESKEFIKTHVLKNKIFNKKYFNVTYIGSFGPHRGLDTLIKAFAYIKQFNHNIKLNLVGAEENTFLEHLREMINSYDLSKFIKIKGWIKPKDVITYISQSDVCIVPHNSNHHTDTTLPWKLSQYMLAKKPVLVSSSPSLARIVKKASSGKIFEADNPRDCANKIMSFTVNQKSLLKFGNNGFEYVFKKGNNWEQKSLPNLLKAYNQIF